MKTDFTFDSESLADNMILTVILIATIYWVLDSILNLFFSNRFNLIAELFGPDLYDVYIRVIVLCLFIIFGSHAQSIINKLKVAKKKLNESEELWRSLVQTAPDIITTVDREGTIHFINQSTGLLTPDQMMGRCFYDFLPQAYHEMAMDSVDSVFRTGETDSFEVLMGEKSDSAWYTYRVGPLSISGKVVAATIIASNTTEFKQAEELRRYKELFDNVAEGVFILNHNGQFIETNERVLETTGYLKGELLKLKLTDLVEPDHVDFVNKTLAQVSREKESRFELHLKSKTNGSIPNEINCRYITYLGEFCYLCVARDITQTKMLQNQLIRSERLAATGQLAASIAHEINSPLQGITALINVIRNEHKNDKNLLEQLDLVKSAFESIRDTVRNLIDLNRPGKEKKQPVNVNQVIENTATLVRSYLTKNRVKINLNMAAKHAMLTASPQQLGQVLMNLINNAVESITGAPEFQKKLEENPAYNGDIFIETFNQNKELVIKVKDSGPGITKVDLERIFDPFFTRKKTMGMGVGLSICHGIIEDHKGYITAENDKDGGAVFTITLPLK
ncbi:MAG: PAS domain S-box protein [Deltaproteobacteria bacterium]|jgi:PAS domain S-box-containing protein|nr:PAS domain S-box protein [Deltaproteobacteria bacterium]MBW2517040.1 PAS domain S-box protein [Deltaproteobacteria bacterium]